MVFSSRARTGLGHAPTWGRIFAAVVILGWLAMSLAGCGVTFFGANWSWGSPAEWAESTERFTLPGAGLAATAFRTHNGSVRVNGHADRETIEVTVTKKGGGDNLADAEECLAAIEISQERRDGVIHFGWRWAEEPRPSRWRAQVSFDVEQPSQLRLTAQTHNGAVTGANIHGGTKVKTHNGGVSLEECRGDMTAQTHNGPIRAEGNANSVAFETHNGSITAHLDTGGSMNGSVRTHNGAVSLNIPDSASTRVRCATHNGRIHAGSRFVTLEKSRRRLVAEIGGGDGELLVRTHNGSITLQSEVTERY